MSNSAALLMAKNQNLHLQLSEDLEHLKNIEDQKDLKHFYLKIEDQRQHLQAYCMNILNQEIQDIPFF